MDARNVSRPDPIERPAPERGGPAPPRGEVTTWLNAWTAGDREALDELIPMVYGELRRIARGYLRGRGRDHTLQPTALIHEAFLRLVGRDEVDWQNRAHFFGVAAKTMRGILVDHARRRGAAKRGGGAVTLAFDERIGVPGQERAMDLVALDDALTSLATLDPELGELVELRYFGGLSIEEAAEVLGVSTGTVKRCWRTARSWLQREMSPNGAAGSGPRDVRPSPGSRKG